MRTKIQIAPNHYRWVDVPSADEVPCPSLGAATGRSVECKSCAGKVRLKTFACATHSECTLTKPAPDTDLSCCATCPDSLAWPRRFDEQNLWPSTPGKRFNPSLLAYESGHLLAARNGWAGSEIYLGRLDADFRPVGEPWRLELRHARHANYGREDPRLFTHTGRVHVVYAGVVGGHKIRHTNVMLARLSARDLHVEQVHYPDLSPRNAWEKNWSPFSHDGGLYAVYTIDPHVIVELSGDKSQRVHMTRNTLPWHGGERRGGASPVRVGEEYWHFFHDRVSGPGGHWVYRTGLYTFAARPPFEALRHVPSPIMTADVTDKPSDQYAAVVFTCGAVRSGDHWVLSSGIHDRWTRLDRFDHSELEKRLVTT